MLLEWTEMKQYQTEALEIPEYTSDTHQTKNKTH